MNDYDRLNPPSHSPNPQDAILGRVLHHLRKWSEDKVPDDDWIADPMFGRLPARLQLQKNTAALARISLRRDDVQRAAGSIVASRDRRSIAKEACHDTRHTAWLESQRTELSTGDWQDLQSLLAIFDWVVRNIQIESKTIDVAAAEQSPVRPRPGVRERPGSHCRRAAVTHSAACV